MIGETISHYEILKKIGEGGMGVVFKARDIKLKRSVVLKFLPKKYTSDVDARKRFVQEAQAAAALNNPNIVTIHEINEHRGHIYIVMEYVEGNTLKDKMTDMETEEIIATAIQVCQGLQAAHKLGIIHRDIKPQNIIINKEEVVKILDFGVAKITEGTIVTDEFKTMGTVHYMSPDQFTGQEIDCRSDIWSLGVVLYELLTKKLPFEEEHVHGVMHAIINEKPIPPCELNENIPGKLESIILKCLQKDREKRYQSAEHLLADLKKLIKHLRKESSEIKIKGKKKVKKETERRQATIVSAEIYGYPEMMETYDAEEAASIMNSCSEMFTVIVENYGGWIDHIMESNLIALFGVPTAIENAPKAAVNTAIEMRNNLDRFNQENHLKTPLDIRIGINTGMVIAGETGKDDNKDYTVVGDTVTLASRLKECSSKSQVYVGQLTYRYTRNEFDYKQLKPVIMKDQTEPVAVCELLSTKEKIYRTVPGSERMIHSEMVGREKELHHLKLHVLKVINGEGSIVTIIGEAGIGKSRLIAELKKTEDIKKVTLLEGRALPIGKHLSYYPIIDILKKMANIEEDLSESAALARLEAAITRIYPEGTAEIFPFVATMMGMKLTGKHADRVKGIEGEALEKLILKNFRDFIVKAAESRTIIVIIEDLHWADVSSIELFESLFKLVEKHRIMVINILRPNYRETGDRILDTLRGRYADFHSEIHIEPLDDKQCEILIHNLMKVSELPAEIRIAIANRAEGNPFFIEEVIRSFIDEGIVELKDGKFKITDKIDSVVIPETIQDVLMARIDRLDETVKTLLKEASVIGRHFFYKILVKVAKNDEDIDENIEYLKGIQLINERTRLGEIEYFFKHALAQEVTYESILLKKRKELHLKVADAIESVFPGRLQEFYGMLALHYNKGENLEKAEEYLIKAGEEALKSAASYEALTYYQEALNLYLQKYAEALDHEKIARLERKIALAFYNKGNYAEAEKHFGKVLEYWGVKRPKSKIAALFYFIIDLLVLFKNLYIPSRKAKLCPSERDKDILEVTYQRGVSLGTIDIYRMVIDSFRLLGTLHKFDLARVRNGVSIYASSSALFSYSGISFPIARKLLDYARSYIKPGDRKTRFKYNYWEGLYDALSGNWDRELEYDETIVDSFLQDGDVFTASEPLFFICVIATGRGDFSTAREYINKLQQLGDVYENDHARNEKYNLNTALLLKSRRLTEALYEAEAGISFARRIDQNLSVLQYMGIKAHAQILLGDISGAGETLLQGNAIESQERSVTPMHISSNHLSRFLFDIYNLEKNSQSIDKKKTKEFRKKAYHSGKAAVKTAVKYAPIRTETFKLMGLYYWLTGKQRKAIDWWCKSIRVGEQLGDRPELARTYMEVGKRLSEKRSKVAHLQGIEAEEYLKKAEVLFKEIELDWDLEELAKMNTRAGT